MHYRKDRASERKREGVKKKICCLIKQPPELQHSPKFTCSISIRKWLSLFFAIGYNKKRFIVSSQQPLSKIYCIPRGKKSFYSVLKHFGYHWIIFSFPPKAIKISHYVFYSAFVCPSGALFYPQRIMAGMKEIQFYVLSHSLSLTRHPRINERMRHIKSSHKIYRTWGSTFNYRRTWNFQKKIAIFSADWKRHRKVEILWWGTHVTGFHVSSFCECCRGRVGAIFDIKLHEIEKKTFLMFPWCCSERYLFKAG